MEHHTPKDTESKTSNDHRAETMRDRVLRFTNDAWEGIA